MPRLWPNYERSFAFDAITSRLAYLVWTHHWIYSLCIWSWLSIQFSLSCRIQEHMRHWLLSSSLLLFVQCVLFPTLPCQLYVNSLASLSLSDSVPGLLPGNLNFYHEMMSWLSWLLSLLTSLIIISSTKEQRSILNNDRFVSRWTASRPPANSCVLVSLPQRDLWRDSRSMLVSNGESVPRCRTIFSLSRQKDGRFRTTVLLNSHLAWGADVLWHGSVDACLFG